MLGVHKGVTRSTSPDGRVLIRSVGNLSAETARCRYRKNSYQEARLPTWSRMGKAIQEQMLLDDTTRPVWLY
jgi:hypothetical protein